MVGSRRSACSALSSRFCGVEPATRTKHRTKHRPQQHQEPHCLRLRLLSYHLGRPIKGYWDTKTTRCTTTWLAARPETGLIQPVDVDAPRRTTGHPWACTSSEIARERDEGVGNPFYKNLL